MPINKLFLFPSKQAWLHYLVAARARTRELPGNYPFVVQETFIKNIIQQWDTPAQDLCKTVFELLMKYVKKLVNAHFGLFGQGGLEQRVKSVNITR
jgi:hypothetical protein